MIGKIISHYKILEKLGEGGMGVVYKAQDTKLDRTVALKFLPKHLLCDHEAKTRFEHEARAASALDHPNIATIYEIDEDEGQCFISMAYIEGKSIKELLKERSFSIEEVLNVAVQICEGLAAAHEKGIVHRDIKSDNIIVTPRGQVKIMDFGLAKLKGVTQLTKVGTTLGTVQYMSPEQAQGKEIDQRSDIFSFGVVLYETATGQLPFKGEYEQAVIYSILNEDPKGMTSLRSGLPKELDIIVNKALAKSVALRYLRVEEILIDLKKVKMVLESAKEPDSTEKPQPSIAVLPFVNLSADPEQEYFCDGMAEEIINSLTHLEGLRVVARTSAFAFKGKQEDIREIGKKLSAETLLEGSVRKAGNKLRITAQLVNVKDGYHLWSERYDREMEDIFAIQDEISLAIVDKLKVKLLEKEKATLQKRYTDNLEAYDLYLKGRYFWNKRTGKDLRKSIECFKQAIEKDSNYALSYAGLADSYIVLADYSLIPPKEIYPQARLEAMKALELDGALTEAYASSAMIKSSFDWDWEGGERDFKSAIELNPGYATAHHWYALHLMNLARFDESIAEIRRALRIDPLSLPINMALGQILFFAGQYDQGIDQLQKVIEMDPGYSLVRVFLGLAYLQKSRYEKALREFQREKDMKSSWNPALEFLFVATYARMGYRSEAERVLQQMLEASKLSYVPPYFIALAHFALGNEDQAFKWIEKGYEEHDIQLRSLKVTPVFDSIRSNSRFKSLLKKMGLEK